MNKGINSTRAVKDMMGQRLRQARKDRGLTINGLSELLNLFPSRPITNNDQEVMNPERLKQWEYGNNPISMEWIPLLCEALQFDVGYLFGEYAEKNRLISDACRTTGLSENAVNRLNRLSHPGHGMFKESGLGIMRKGYIVPLVDCLSDLIEHEKVLEVLDDLAYYKIFGGALPEDAYTNNVEELTDEEYEKFYKWANSHFQEVIPRKYACELFLQKAGDELKNMFRDILTKELEKHG